MHYNHQNIGRARTLRKEMTPWERKLWYCFLKTYPVRFQRQYPMGVYIVDFVCRSARLILELDGGGHYEMIAAEKDRVRTQNLEEMGYKVLRFCNTDIDKHFYEVCSVIDREVKKRTGTPCLPL